MPVGVYKRTRGMMTGKHMLGRVPWNKGRKCSTEEIARMSGPMSSRWKGGVSLGEKDKEYQKNYRDRLRNSVLSLLGGKCAKCGFSDQRALQIDHVKGGGNKERKSKGAGWNYYKHVASSLEKKEGKYQLLCANCNWIKRHENNEMAKK